MGEVPVAAAAAAAAATELLSHQVQQIWRYQAHVLHDVLQPGLMQQVQMCPHQVQMCPQQVQVYPQQA